MPIPQEILAVERPKNTVVIAYGKNKERYAVRQRVGCKNIDGRHVPINGPTIGHIVNGKYIPKDMSEPPCVASIATDTIDLKDWGNIILCDRIFKSIQAELDAVYNHEDSIKIYCIAILRVCYPGIKDYELKEAYDSSFLSELYPGVSLSRNTVSAFWNDLGKTVSLIVKFMKNRTSAVALDHHLLIDGTLKSNESKVNSFSNFSRKAKTKGTRDISVLYAFDLENMEPICSKCYPGNMLDVTAYSDFISSNGITKGIIVADKGFPSSAAKDEFDKNPDLHYLNPVKRNSKLIETHKMYAFTDILPGYDGITYRKEKCVGTEKWIYSFRDSRKASYEEYSWLEKAKKEGTYKYNELLKKQKSFGTIVLECDLDLPPKTVYTAYDKRWEIELMMRYYKQACEFDETRVQDDYSVIGSEFCSFLSSLLTCRIVTEFDKSELLEKHSHKKLISVLSRAKKIRVDGNEWISVKLNPSQIEILQKLNLLPKSSTENAENTEHTQTGSVEKKHRGRPKGSKNKPKK